MPMRVMKNRGVVEGAGYVHGMSCISRIDSPAAMTKFNGDRRCSIQEKAVVVTGKEEIRREEKEVNTCSISSSSTSSIGKNSDLSSGDKVVENSSDTVTDHEVQSPYKGPLNAMEDLEEVLPIRRGISRFYNGKSKSFASLADASPTTSMKELAKPENAYIRRRRNLLATSCMAWEKNRNSSFLKSNGGGVSKRITTTANRTTTALALAVVTMGGGNNNGKCSTEFLRPNFTASSASSSPPPHPTILHNRLNPHLVHNFALWRSFSLVDLQQCVSVPAAPHTPLDVKPS